MNKIDATAEELLLLETLQDARKVQEFIWGELSLMNNTTFDANTWAWVFQKRINKINAISKNNHNYKAELRKRVLQQAALSICALTIINKLK